MLQLFEHPNRGPLPSSFLWLMHFYVMSQKGFVTVALNGLDSSSLRSASRFLGFEAASPGSRQQAVETMEINCCHEDSFAKFQPLTTNCPMTGDQSDTSSKRRIRFLDLGQQRLEPVSFCHDIGLDFRHRLPSGRLGVWLRQMLLRFNL